MGYLLDKYTGHFPPADRVSPAKERSVNLGDEVYSYLRNNILLGILPPGKSFLEAEIEDLIRKTGADKVLIRDALLRLAADSLVDYQPYLGFSVAVLELADLREIYFLRSMLEGTAARLACQNLTAEGLGELELLCEHMEDCLRKNHFAKLSRLNTAFHETIYAAANSPLLFRAIIQLWNGFLHSSLGFLTLRAPSSVKEHRAVYQALAKRAEDEAEQIIKAHLTSAFTDLEEYWSHRFAD